jgi:cation:H+ antiporter
MLAALVQFAVSAVVIVIAGTFLARFADEIAERTGFGRLLVGSVLLAGSTSLPELTVGISAVRAGHVDLAVGDYLGAILLNLLILGVLDLTTYSRGRIMSRLAAGHALSGCVGAALMATVALCLLTKPLSASGSLLGVSYGLLLVLLGYMAGMRMIYFDQQASAAEAEVAKLADTLMDTPPPPKSLVKMLGGFGLAALAILASGPFLAEAADQLASATGLGHTFVGTTLVALCTSLPESVASFTAVRMGAHDLAIGNVFGSNAFNLLLLVPLDLFHPGPMLEAVSPHHAVTCLAGIIGTHVVILGQLYKVERRSSFIEPDAWLVILVVLGALGLVYQLG